MTLLMLTRHESDIQLRLLEVVHYRIWLESRQGQLWT